jgi:hypothetical protein
VPVSVDGRINVPPDREQQRGAAPEGGGGRDVCHHCSELTGAGEEAMLRELPEAWHEQAENGALSRLAWRGDNSDP